MYIKVKDEHPFYGLLGEQDFSCDCQVIQNAEAGAIGTEGMVGSWEMERSQEAFFQSCLIPLLRYW